MVKATAKPPALGARVRASGYMARYSSVRAWRARNPDADSCFPDRGVKGLKRVAESFSGVYVGTRVRIIKAWWVGNRGDPGSEEWHYKRTYLTLWLVAYSHRAKLRYVLPKDAEVLP